MRRYIFMVAIVLLQACGAAPDSAIFPSKDNFQKVTFSTLPNWQQAEFKRTAEGLRNSCHALKRHNDRITGGTVFSVRFADWQELCEKADSLKDSEMRWFLKTYFVAYAYKRDGFYTGYFEAHVNGSKTRTKTFRHPVLALPKKPLRNQSRKQIEQNYKEFTPLFWTDDPIDLFLAQIQGSARVTFTDGTKARIGYGGNNGYKYSSIGKYLLQTGKAKSFPDGWLSIRNYLQTHPDEVQDIFWQNDRYIFFQLFPADENAPYGRLDTPLIAGRSLAADSKLMPFGVPVWIDISPNKAVPFTAKLMFIHDTGSAIKGIGRGDIFFGFGKQALNYASRLQHGGKFYILLPKNYIERIKP